MPRRNRHLIVDPDRPQSWHVSNRCARSLFLLEPGGEHAAEGERPCHRKEMLLARLEALVAVTSIEVLAFSVMGNHMHLVLRNVPKIGHGWSAQEVLDRWLTLHPLRNRQGLRDPEAGELEALLTDAAWVASTRRKLMDLSQFMKELKQHVAVEVNKLEGGSGAFWSGRYKSKSIDDPDGHQLVRSMVYVDLNPLAAGLCKTPEAGRYTSLEGRLGRDRVAAEACADASPDTPPKVAAVRRSRSRAWLVPLAGEDPTARASDSDGDSQPIADPLRGRVVFAGLTLLRYLRLVDAVARLLRSGKAALNRRVAPILERLGLAEEDLRERFEKMATGTPHF